MGAILEFRVTQASGVEVWEKTGMVTSDGSMARSKANELREELNVIVSHRNCQDVEPEQQAVAEARAVNDEQA